MGRGYPQHIDIPSLPRWDPWGPVCFFLSEGFLHSTKTLSTHSFHTIPVIHLMLFHRIHGTNGIFIHTNLPFQKIKQMYVNIHNLHGSYISWAMIFIPPRRCSKIHHLFFVKKRPGPFRRNGPKQSFHGPKAWNPRSLWRPKPRCGPDDGGVGVGGLTYLTFGGRCFNSKSPITLRISDCTLQF